MSSQPPDRLRDEPIPAVPAAGRTIGRLPTPLTPLVGRETERRAIAERLHDPRVHLLTLTGPGGVGKTRLAMAVAGAIAGEYAGDAVFVDLSSIRDPALVLPTIAGAFGLREAGQESLLSRLGRALGAHLPLLILDNLEQVIEAAPQVAALLAETPELTVLATSRVLLRVSGEHIFVVPPLSLGRRDGETERRREEMVPSVSPSLRLSVSSEAVALFVERASAVDPTFALDETNAATIAAICTRLDGLPLAIELAAARVRHLAPATILARLERRLDLLAGGARDHPFRLQTMRDAIAWSHDLLDEREQLLFRRLAVFVGGCTLEAIEAVCNGDGDLGGTALDAVAALVDHSLLRREAGAAPAPADEEHRYGMLETLLAFARERLAASGEEEALQARHAAYFLAFVEQAKSAFFTHAEAGWVRRIDVEQPNLRAAIAWAAEQTGSEILVRLLIAEVSSGGTMVLGIGRYERLERAVTASADGPVAVRGQRAILLATTARAATLQGKIGRAAALVEESLALARTAEDPRAIAHATLELGRLALVQGDADRAEPVISEALRRMRELEEPGWIAEALYLLAWNAGLRDDHERSEALFLDALNLARANGAYFMIAGALEALGTCALDRGDFRRAAPLFAESLTMLRAGGDPGMVANCLKSLGAVAGFCDQAEQAARLLGAAEALRERLGMDPPPIEQQRIERAVAPARARLSPTAFAAAWTEGRSVPLEQAIAEALTVADAVTAMPDRRQAPAGLSRRELQVLELMAAGRTDQEIADALYVSRRTVNSHVASILAKLGVKTRREAATVATDRRFI